ncbi:MAG: pitrilysin family protein [Pseudomonadota bacterium]|nr:pitrilysin family protein [Pseudomonadota bacterium]
MIVRVCLLLAVLGIKLSVFTAAQAADIKKVISSKGIEAWFVQDSSVPLIAMNFVFRGVGSVTDPEGREGLAKMSAALLDEGAGELQAAEFQKKLEEIAARLSFSAGRDNYSGRLSTLVSERDQAFNLLKLSLNRPRFDERPVERIRDQFYASLIRNVEVPQRVLGRKWSETVFAGHAYSRPSDGTKASIASITKADLNTFVSTRFTRDRLIVGVVGDISEAELGRRLDQVFGGLPKIGRTFNVPDVVPTGAGKTIVVKMSIPQSAILLGHAGIKREDPDWYAALLVSRIFGGGGLSSRLYEEIREKRGLAYSVYSYLNPMQKSALVVGSVATKNARAGESLSLIKAEWDQLSKKGVSAEELRDAKTYTNGSFPLRLGSSRGIAELLVGMQLSKLGENYIEERPSLINAVTLEDANRVARRVYDVKKLTTVVVGDPEGVVSTP